MNPAAPGLLANDSEPDSTASPSDLRAVLEASPSHGTLVLYGDGSFDYTPVAGLCRLGLLHVHHP
jgi:hypothetical protein